MSAQLTQIQPLSQPVDLGVEPATFSPEVEAEIDRHLAKYPVPRSAILPLMFIVQRERGYLDPPGVLYLARRLALRVTDIWEVATFYSMIHTTAIGKYHIQVCKTLSCKIMYVAGSFLPSHLDAAEDALSKLDFLVVQELFETETTARRKNPAIGRNFERLGHRRG